MAAEPEVALASTPMGSVPLNRWMPALFAIAAGLFAIVSNWLSGNQVFAVILLVFFALIGWWSWPSRQGNHVDHAAAQAAAGDDDLIIYWRPG